jgi:FkbM family methyltransferase
LSLIRTLRFVTHHPLNKGRAVYGLWRFLLWQVRGRLNPDGIVVKNVGSTRLCLRRSNHVASAIAYTGFPEFEEMAFVLHCLRPEDLFVDVGANIGHYSVIAGGASGADCISFEPIPATFEQLTENVNLNKLGHKIDVRNVGVGAKSGTLSFTTGADSMNHVAAETYDAGQEVVEVPVVTLDEVLSGRKPAVIKIDVEGFEKQVIAGAGSVLRDPGLLSVVIELNGSGYRYGIDENEIHETMLGYGFDGYVYEPFGRALSPLHGRRPTSGDTLYIRDIDTVEVRVKDAPRNLINGKLV